MKKTMSLFLFVLMVCGCATTNFTWNHSLYINESTFMRDKEECAAYADRVYAARRAAISPYLMSMGLNMMASQPTPYPQSLASSIGEAALKSGITQMPIDTSGYPFDNCMYAKGYYKVNVEKK